jgi:hypothetical protein
MKATPLIYFLITYNQQYQYNGRILFKVEENSFIQCEISLRICKFVNVFFSKMERNNMAKYTFTFWFDDNY